MGSTRWCPTPEQVMILEEMYRSGFIRTPSATQIQQITAQLSLYGKIEGKNVFYWFQNHKARDRQKLRRKLMFLHLQYQNHQQPPNYFQLLHNYHFLYPPPIFHNTSPQFLGGVEDGHTKQMNYTWNDKKSTNSRDWTWIDVGPSGPSCKRPPETLQLFPIKTCKLDDDDCTKCRGSI